MKLAWRYRPIMRARVHGVIAENRYPDLGVVRLRGQRQVDRRLDGPLARNLR
ncbi:hypothetical protein P3102_30410 [Amycolatopsis sp. QT-25]|uniref:hypothetical protein n=1 Tax=Amycolatopsis sp. QT-25 TaxID=3034022 RepID=UPI0023EBD3B2|nr:hypothetical protein [Amycolatopsis sp. QT-25]WET78339.1 hypothetical protein P3102_30410 [Amycolatopsis sp. QT-25]